MHTIPPKAQVTNTHWKHISYLLTPPVGVMGAPSSRAPVKLQQSANPPADKTPPDPHALTSSHPRCGSLFFSPGLSAHQQGEGSSQHLAGKMLHQVLGEGHYANGISSGNINLGLMATVNTPMYLPTVNNFHASFTILFKWATSLLRESLGELV